MPLFCCANATEDCKEHTLDFVVLEGDATLAAIEDDIRAQLAPLGITVNTRMLEKEAFNTAMTTGDFHMCFSETWGAPYDPTSYATGWMANDEAHYSAMSGLAGSGSRANVFAKIDAALAAETEADRQKLWEEFHILVHESAINFPLWGKRIPSVLNQRLGGYYAGFQQFDYPVHKIVVVSGSKTVTIAPGAQTGLFQSVGPMNPHGYRPNEFFSNNWIYEGLVSYGSDGSIVPALAESWTESGNTVTFKLRAGVKFHDGEDWNCDVAKLNFNHVLEGELATSAWHGWYRLPLVLSNWTCNSDGDFVLTTSSPHATLMQELSFIRPLRMLSPASFATNASDGHLTNNSCPPGWSGDLTAIHCSGITSPVGTGPFKYVSRSEDGDKDAEVVFHRFDDYWGGPPDIEVLKIKYYETASAVKAALLDGSLDMVAGAGVLAPADLTDFKTTHASDFYTFESRVLMHSLVILNSGKSPTDDIQVRKAIIHGVDKAAIIKRELGGDAVVVDRLFPESAPYCQVELTPRWDYDIEKATMLNCPENSSQAVADKQNEIDELRNELAEKDSEIADLKAAVVDVSGPVQSQTIALCLCMPLLGLAFP